MEVIDYILSLCYNAHYQNKEGVFSMAQRRRITNKNSVGERIKRLEHLETLYRQEWKSDFTIGFCRAAYAANKQQEGLAKETLITQKNAYNSIIKYLKELGNEEPEELPVDILGDEGVIMGYTAYLRNKQLRPASVNTYLRHYKGFCFWLESEGYLEVFHDFKIKREQAEVKDVYTVDELNKLMVKPPITNFHAFRSYCMISLMLNTGARRKTLTNIKIGDVDFTEGYIAFNTTKTKKAARLGLERKTRKDLLEFVSFWRKDADENDYLFCSEFGEKMTECAVNRAITKYNHDRGVEKTSIHLFRHTFAKMWITSGGNIISLAQTLTHSDLDMVKHYSNLYGADIKKDIESHSAIAQLKTKSGKTLKNLK